MLFVVPIHILSVLKPPAQVLKSIKRAFSHFPWGDSEGKAGKFWISWAMTTNPIEEGGWG